MLFRSAVVVERLLLPSLPVAPHHPLELVSIIIAMMWLLQQVGAHTTILLIAEVVALDLMGTSYQRQTEVIRWEMEFIIGKIFISLAAVRAQIENLRLILKLYQRKKLCS